MAWDIIGGLVDGYGFSVERDFATDTVKVWCPAGLVTPARVVTITAKQMDECNGNLVRALQQALVVNQFDPFQRSVVSDVSDVSDVSRLDTPEEPPAVPWHHRELDLD